MNMILYIVPLILSIFFQIIAKYLRIKEQEKEGNIANKDVIIISIGDIMLFICAFIPLINVFTSFYLCVISVIICTLNDFYSISFKRRKE